MKLKNLNTHFLVLALTLSNISYSMNNKTNTFIHFNQLPEDIQKEILIFTLGFGPEDLNLEPKTPTETVEMLNKIHSLKLINKKTKNLIDKLYLNNFDKEKTNKTIKEKREILGNALIKECHKSSQNINMDAAIKLIIDGAIDTHCDSELLNNSLRWSSRQGHEKLVDLLIKTQSKLLNESEFKKYINSVDCYKRSAIMLACIYYHTNIIKILIKANVNLDLTDNILGSTALMIVATNKKLTTSTERSDIIKLLIENDANIEIKDICEKKALDLSIDEDTRNFILDTAKKYESKN